MKEKGDVFRKESLIGRLEIAFQQANIDNIAWEKVLLHLNQGT
jgi:hypothetical protein